MSSVREASTWLRFSMAIAACSDGASTLSCSTCLVRRTPKGLLAAISAATPLAASSSRSAATTRLTSPMRSASAASINRPVSISSEAWPKPTTRGSIQDTPTSQPDSPMRTKATLKDASGAAMRTSAASASARPPPEAGPLTAAITAFGSDLSAAMASAPCSWTRMNSCTLMSGSVPISSRSAPAQNPRPAPVSTSARTRGSPSTAAHSACSSSNISALMAFSRPGRSRVTSATPSCGPSKRRVLNS
jgi:hypothetical protein